MSPRKKKAQPEPEVQISKKVARACLGVAKADLTRVRDKKFSVLPPKFATQRILKLWEEEQDRRIAACNERIEKYSELAK